ncbi:unnamed protein product [Clavelina lepadiformis]|uniref:SEA domain-containing protein n=1 Tax=Clavelina lepadiformis TaxID=159417 RepID=A0ABP0H243_CLALP
MFTTVYFSMVVGCLFLCDICQGQTTLLMANDSTTTTNSNLTATTISSSDPMSTAVSGTDSSTASTISNAVTLSITMESQAMTLSSTSTASATVSLSATTTTESPGSTATSTLTMYSTSPAVTITPNSVIEKVSSNDDLQNALMKENITIEMFFMRVVVYANNQSNNSIQEIFNSTTGQLLFELIQSNSSAILENYNEEVEEENRVFFYATLLDLENRASDESFVSNYLNHVVLGNTSISYNLNTTDLRYIACDVYKEAGGTRVCSSNVTEQDSVLNLGLIIGCSVAGLLVIVILSVALCYYFTNVLPASKVNPGQGSDIIDGHISCQRRSTGSETTSQSAIRQTP